MRNTLLLELTQEMYDCLCQAAQEDGRIVEDEAVSLLADALEQRIIVREADEMSTAYERGHEDALAGLPAQSDNESYEFGYEIGKSRAERKKRESQT